MTEETNSTHKAEVFRIDNISPHPNADRLEIIRVFDGYVCCVGLGEYHIGDLAVYITPDSIVPKTEQFAFLDGHQRIKVKKLRGIVSMGLIIPAPEGSQEGDDVAALLGIEHYEPPLTGTTGGEATRGPGGYRPIYDLDSLRRYARLFEEGEPVFLSEKIHGASARFCLVDDEIHCGSRREWKKYDAGNLWWRALATQDGVMIESFLRNLPDNEGITIYAEIFGIQDLRYGLKSGEIKIAVFDLLHEADWIDALEARAIGPNLPWVPTIASNVPFQLDWVLAQAEGQSLIPGANHVREGIVVKPMKERWNDRLGRVCLKAVSNSYLERSK